MQEAVAPSLTRPEPVLADERGPAAPRPEPHRARASWLINDDMDRERMLDMDRLVAPVRQKSFIVIAVALLHCHRDASRGPRTFKHLLV